MSIHDKIRIYTVGFSKDGKDYVAAIEYRLTEALVVFNRMVHYAEGNESQYVIDAKWEKVGEFMVSFCENMSEKEAKELAKQYGFEFVNWPSFIKMIETAQ